MVQLSKLHDFRVSFVLHINKKEIFGTNSITSESHILYFVTFSPRTNILISVCFFSSVTTILFVILFTLSLFMLTVGCLLLIHCYLIFL